MADTYVDTTGVTWNFSTKYVVVRGVNRAYAYLSSAPTGYDPNHIVIPDTMYSSGRAYPVGALASFSNNSSVSGYSTSSSCPLKNNKQIRAIFLPKPMAVITNEAFANCTSLEEVGMAGTALEAIEANAFLGCTNLTKVRMPNNNILWYIGTGAFSGCTSLDLHVPASVTYIEPDAFKDCKYVHMEGTTPPTLTSNNLVGNAIIYVPDEAVATYKAAPYWSSMANKILGESELTSTEVTVTAEANRSALHIAVGESNLLNTISLKVHGTINSYDIMIIRNKMLNLRNLDLSDCSVVANSYEYYTGYHSQDNVLGNYVFSELPLQVLHLPKNLVSIHDCCTDCPCLDTVYCQPGLQTIGTNAFQRCTSLRHVAIQEGVTTIGQCAFAECFSLRSLVLPNSLATIGQAAFYNADLEHITIPANVSTIGNYAFLAKRQGLYYTSSSENHFGSFYIPGYNNSFYYCGLGTLKSLTFAPGSKLKKISKYAFVGQDNLQTINWAEGLEEIEYAAFAFNKSLVNRTFPRSLKTIGKYAFEDCDALDTITLPPFLETIEERAFQHCPNLDVIKISAGVKNIGNYAFNGSNNVTKVYTYTIEPTNILQQTFSCWTVADLYVSKTAYYNYYYNTQWSQFVRLVEFDEPYDYFYLNGDITLGGEHGNISGNPDVDLNPGAGIIVTGNDVQGFGTVILQQEDGTGASILADANIVIDTLDIQMMESKDKWHFLTFPYDVNRQDIRCNSEFVVRYYDGARRAVHGGADRTNWINVPVGTQMKNGQGYIFQAAHNDTLRLLVPNPVVRHTDTSFPLYTYASTNAWDANWNMVGNPFITYYDLDSLSIKGFTYPVIVWNGVGYDTYRVGDDSYHFVPLEGFFVQNASLDSIRWSERGRETRVQAQEKVRNSFLAPARGIAPNTENSRSRIDLTLSTADYTDRTRVVFNSEASVSYEIGIDAAKMLTSTAPVQLYTIGLQNEQYSINERPATAENEHILLGYYSRDGGHLTLDQTRMEASIVLYDNVEQQVVDLSQGAYTFFSGAGVNNTRFALLTEIRNAPTAIDEIIEQYGAGAKVYEWGGFYFIQAGGKTYKRMIVK